MAYQFFKTQQQQQQQSKNKPPPAQTSYNGRHNQPPIHPQRPMFPPSSASSASSSGTGTTEVQLKQRETSVEPTPYPHAIATCPTPHPHITIESVSTAHIPSLTRITGLLLPIRYPNSFYTATITDPVVASLSRVAIYRDHPAAAPSSNTSSAKQPTSTDKVIGGIRCRLERLPQITSELLRNTQSQSQSQSQESSPTPEPTNLYIQTLHLLSPYRGNGVAAALLNSLLFSDASKQPAQVSELVRHYNIRTVSAHVHEANDDALKWYVARGFQVQDTVVENYYRRLKPSGARIVKLFLQWTSDEKAGPQGEEVPEPLDGKQDVVEQGSYDGDDEDWEKVEAEGEDEDERQDHGVQLLTDSKVLDPDEGGSRKRKAADDLQHDS